ncbi:MAG TPA: hypothetical protein PKD20_00220 [Candidatus Saccharibacteria bacterium]|jgi:formate hydrogenlyase subunit 4|nr:hypothetical protein [Candidatus Saccharibacteria bacterium]HMT55281.1 hypothetical protein [Candidatus Saccharibacteria bacterium]
MKPKENTSKRIIALLLVSFMLFHLLTLLPVVFFGLAGSPEQNNHFFNLVRLFFAGPITLLVIVSSLLSLNQPDEKVKKIKKVRNYTFLLIILANAFLITL